MAPPLHSQPPRTAGAAVPHGSGAPGSLITWSQDGLKSPRVPARPPLPSPRGTVAGRRSPGSGSEERQRGSRLCERARARARKADLRPGPRCRPLILGRVCDRLASPQNREVGAHPPSEAWGSPAGSLCADGPPTSRLLEVGSVGSCQAVRPQVEGGVSKRSTAWKPEMSKKKQSPRERESSNHFRNGHSAPQTEDFLKSDFSVSESNPSRCASKTSGFFYTIFMLNVFATYMFWTDLISQAKLAPYSLVSVLFPAQAENLGALFSLSTSADFCGLPCRIHPAPGH